MITILETAPLNTIQDQGRPGYRNLGVGSSGVMDPLALKIGNILLGNDLDAACIELQTYPFVIRFDTPTSFAVTGIEAPLTLDGRPVLAWSVETAAPGQMLRVGIPRTGARAYVCVGGGIDVPVVLGSRSTQLRGSFGGMDGRFLEAGDELATQPATEPLSGYGSVPPARVLNHQAVDDKTILLRAIPGTDYARFTPESRERFWNQGWRITPQSNRVGYRLSGRPLAMLEQAELRSYGIIPGIIQVPPAGEPIVQLADANTAGGYPRIATVIEADLWCLAQARIGTSIRFVECNHKTGIAAEQHIKSYLDDLRLMVAQYRASCQSRNGTNSRGKA